MFQDTGSPIVSWLIVSSIGQVSVECRSSIGQVSAKYQRSVGQASAKCRRRIGDLKSYVGPHTCRSTVDRYLVDTRSTVGRLSIDSRPSVDRVLTEEKVDGKALRARLVLISISGSRACLNCAFPFYSCRPYYPRAWNRLQYWL